MAQAPRMPKFFPIDMLSKKLQFYIVFADTALEQIKGSSHILRRIETKVSMVALKSQNKLQKRWM
jgi:hypothetical protein